MMVLIVERAPAGLRGELSRWLLEPHAGLFVGRVSAMVREKLWQRTCKGLRNGAAIMIWRSNNEQGFEFLLWGDPSRSVTDWDGLKLVTLCRDRYPKRRQQNRQKA
jgi:CRISPR-associated protein Cas2